MRRFAVASISLLVAFVGLCGAARASTVVLVHWIGGVGNWSDAANWSPHQVPDNTASTTFDVLIGTIGAQVTLDSSVTVDTLRVDNDPLTVTDATLTIASGTVELNSGSVNLDAVNATADLVLGGAAPQLTGGAGFVHLNPQGTSTPRIDPATPGVPFLVAPNLTIEGAGGIGQMAVVNQGNVFVQAPGIVFDGTGESPAVDPAITNRGTITVDAAATLTLASCDGYSQTAGDLGVDGTVDYGTDVGGSCGGVGNGIDIAGGELYGKGSFVHSPAVVLHSGATLFPNGLSVDDAVALSGTFRLVAVGANPDQLVAPALDLSGATLTVQVQVAPAVGATLTLARITGGPVTGTFAGLPDGAVLRAGPSTFVVHYNVVSGSDHLVTLTALRALSVGDVSVPEGDAGTTVAKLTVRLWPPATSNVTFHYATVDGTATAPADYVAVPVTPATILAGKTAATISVKIKADAIPEGDEQFTVVLSGVTGATVVDGTGTATVLDDDDPKISVGDVDMYEGNIGRAPLVFTVRMSNAAAIPVTVHYATADTLPVSAHAGSDYVATAGNLTFQPGQTSKAVAVSVIGDATVENDEVFDLRLSGASLGTITDNIGQGGIINDDARGAVAGLTIGDAFVTEGNSGSTTAAFTVRLTNAAASPFTVHYHTTDGTATAGADYTAVSDGVLSFATGDTAQLVPIVVQADTVDEANETFTVTLSNVSNGGRILDGSGTGTIRDDDGPTTPTLSVGDVAVPEGTQGTANAIFVVRLSAPSSTTVTVHYATVAGTADFSDFQPVGDSVLTFDPGQLSKTVAVKVRGDSIDEPDETFSLQLSNSTAVVARATGTATIQNL